MSKRGRINLGLLSAVVAMVGASGLSACGSDSSDGGGGGGKGGASHGGQSGTAGESAGGAAAGSAGKPTVGEGGAAGSAGAGEAGSGEAGDSAGGMGGEAGATTTWIVDPQLKALSPLPALPADPTNKYADDANAAALGQALFFDKRYSGALSVASDLGIVGDTGKVACATCHSGAAMSDGRAPFTVTVGTGTHTRNAPALVNSSFYEWTNWGGRFAAQWELPLAVAENPLTMASTRLKLAHFIYDNYKTQYEAIFGALPAALDATASDATRFPATGKPGDATWDTDTSTADKAAVNQIIVNYGKALEAYMRKLVSRNAPFDQYVANGAGDLTESAIRGAALFVGKAKCNSCHSGPFFSDNQFHNLGGLGADDGRFKDAGALKGSALNIDGVFSDKTDTGRLANLTNPMTDVTTHSAFRTASLREVKDTAPYMHAGQLADLPAVVAFYNAGGGEPVSGSTKDPLLTPLGLSETEQADLVEFLKTLSGEPVPGTLLAAP
ncbi:MAG TPA: cytochrome c peroxidase [Polyangiaceae bacterium]|nr:cytochrome c peroxidase [Polyangiaceae bacterium]